VKQQRATGGRKRQTTQLVENHCVDQTQLLGQIVDLAQAFFAFELVDQIDGIEEAHPLGLKDRCHADGRG
jgi:hypothetical protein